jgi:hypothetical protein
VSRINSLGINMCREINFLKNENVNSITKNDEENEICENVRIVHKELCDNRRR